MITRQQKRQAERAAKKAAKRATDMVQTRVTHTAQKVVHVVHTPILHTMENGDIGVINTGTELEIAIPGKTAAVQR